MSTETFTAQDEADFYTYADWYEHVDQAVRLTLPIAPPVDAPRSPCEVHESLHLLLVFLLAVTGITVAVIAAVAYAAWVGAGVVAGVVGLALLIRYAVKDVTP